MNILIVNENDTMGGAARASFRLHQGLQRLDYSSHMLVNQKASMNNSVFGPVTTLEKIVAKLSGHIDSLPLKFCSKRQNNVFSLQWFPNVIRNKIKQYQPDIVHLHWICNGFISIEGIAKIKKPLIWTLHDSWPFTGGCHLPLECKGYIKSCGACPQLGSQRDRDLSSWVWGRKKQAWQGLDLTIVTPSRWLADCARQSSLLANRRIEVIPNGIDLNRYKPIEKAVARDLLNFPPDKKLILLGAVNARTDYLKGFHLLQESLQILSEGPWRNSLELVVAGDVSRPENEASPFPSHFLGFFHDEISMALLYAAVDIVVVPSIQENLPNTIMEAMACGTPGVAFSVGGIPEMIDHQKNGYLAKAFDTEDLAQGISWVISDSRRYRALQKAARVKATQEFEISQVARRYVSLYQELIDR